MGIDLYAQWRGQTEAELKLQGEACGSIGSGHVGYLRESAFGWRSALRHLAGEAFRGDGKCQPIEAAVLRSRLEKTLRLVEKKMRKSLGEGHPFIDIARESVIDFVELCERKERESGEPVHICALY